MNRAAQVGPALPGRSIMRAVRAIARGAKRGDAQGTSGLMMRRGGRAVEGAGLEFQ